MNLIEALKSMIGKKEELSYFQILEKVTDLTNHIPVGFIWMHADHYSHEDLKAMKPDDIGLVFVEWLPYDPRVKRCSQIEVLEMMLTIMKRDLKDFGEHHSSGQDEQEY